MPRKAAPDRKAPTREDVLRLIESSAGDLDKRDIARAYRLKGVQRDQLKRVVKDLERDGLLGRRAARSRLGGVRDANTVLVEFTGVDDQGDLTARGLDDEGASFTVPTEELEGQAPGKGDRALVKLYRQHDGTVLARLVKVLPRVAPDVVGVLESAPDGLRLRPADRKNRLDYMVGPTEAGDAVAGDLVRAEVLPVRHLSLPRARVVERIGRPDDPKAVSVMAAMGAGLPMSFPADTLALAARATPVGPEGRLDLRTLDLVTIDGADARDFDDAVWATPDTAADNKGGYRIVVAIADVAHYVRPGDALDREARNRGNSVYFPDRVIPMLPEALSNDLCSLRPDEDRACLTVEMRIDAKGEIGGHTFARALMRSRARLTYEQVQAAKDGEPDEATAPLVARIIEPLYGAYALLAAARRERGALELDLPERKIEFDEAGWPAAFRARERLASHMLIEEFMIAANVCAARALEAARQPCMYRVHDKPDPIKLEALAQFMEELGLPWSRTAKKPGDFTRLLEKLGDHEMKPMVSSLILRSQAQAVYQPENLGHFGLNLLRYAHFTSPIRRYSDLVVHRGLIRGLKLGQGGLEDGVDQPKMASLGEHISRCERRAMEAERKAFERFVALYMSAHVGARFPARVAGTQRFGLFVKLDDTGAEGLVPVSSLGSDLFAFDERRHALVGQRTGIVYGIGDTCEVELVESDGVTGSLLFKIVRHEPGRGAEAARAAWRKQPKRSTQYHRRRRG